MTWGTEWMLDLLGKTEIREIVAEAHAVSGYSFAYKDNVTLETFACSESEEFLCAVRAYPLREIFARFDVREISENNIVRGYLVAGGDAALEFLAGKKKVVDAVALRAARRARRAGDDAADVLRERRRHAFAKRRLPAAGGAGNEKQHGRRTKIFRRHFSKRRKKFIAPVHGSQRKPAARFAAPTTSASAPAMRALRAERAVQKSASRQT